MLVVGVQDGVFACEDVVAGERERHPARRSVSGQRRDDEVRIGLNDVFDQIVDRLEVAPGLLGWVLGRLDHVQVNAV